MCASINELQDAHGAAGQTDHGEIDQAGEESKRESYYDAVRPRLQMCISAFCDKSHLIR